jgi:hypothetical protein
VKRRPWSSLLSAKLRSMVDGRTDRNTFPLIDHRCFRICS